ncbi:MAG TPA: adenosylcobinamide-GDP ribazoletransferase [Ktedonobacteraceae bacterium]
MRQYLKLLAATSFLSTLPLPGSRLLAKLDATDVLLGGEYFPLVGLMLGGVLWLLVLLSAPLVPQLLLTAFLVVTLVLLTGGLHLDGLMDSCDGLFGGFTRERKLEVMRDSRLGSFGVLGGACTLLLKFACLASLHEHSLPVVLLVTLPSSRWGMVLALRTFPSARATGLGATFRQTVTLPTLIIAGVCALAIVLVSAQLAGLLVWGTVTLTTLTLGIWITRQLGGLTGDTYGAIAEITEITGLLTFVLLHF